MTAPTPPEVQVETLRRVLLDHHPMQRTKEGPLTGCRCGQVKLGQDVIAHVAAQVIAALPPSPTPVEFWRCTRCHRAPEQHAGGRESADCVYVPELAASGPSPAEEAVKRVEALRAVWTRDGCHVVPYKNLRAALASPAPAPCWCMACEHLHVRARTEAGDPLAMFARRFIVCPDCGNKRCPKATHHDLACTGSNEPGQPGSAYEQVVAPPVSAEELRARILDQSAPRDRYAQCDDTCTVDCGACKGKGPQ